MNNFPKLESNRLILNRIRLSDVEKIVEYAGNIKIARYTLNIPHPYNEEDAVFWINSANQGYLNKTQFTFAIRLKESGVFIGGVGLKINKRFNRSELGYWIGEPYWNQGYASESVGRMLVFGFKELKLNKIYATHLIENPASGKVMMNNGMIKEGELKEHFMKGNDYTSVIQYRMTKTEYENKTSNED